MSNKIIYFCSLFFVLFTTLVFSAEKAFIQITVDKEIITNIDIKKESDYLKILNPNLSTLSEKRINEIAKKSLITEIIKNKEINKFLVKMKILNFKKIF